MIWFSEEQVTNIINAIFDAAAKSEDKRLDFDSSNAPVHTEPNEYMVELTKYHDVPCEGNCRLQSHNRIPVGHCTMRLIIKVEQNYEEYEK